MNSTQQHVNMIKYYLEGFENWELASLCDVSTPAYNNAKNGVTVRDSTRLRIEAISALLERLVEECPIGSPHYYHTMIVEAKNGSSKWRTTKPLIQSGLNSE